MKYSAAQYRIVLAYLVVVPAPACMEIACIGAIKLIEAVEHVLGCMAVHDVKEHGDTEAMRSVNEAFEVLGRPKP